MNRKNNRLLPSDTANKLSAQLLNFSGVKIPVPTEQIGKFNDKYRPCGTDNLFPNFLLQLYNSSTTHNAIINKKRDYIIGDGLKYKNGSDLQGMPNASESWSEFVNKIVLDLEIFNRFAVEVEYNKVMQPIGFHFVPVWQVRFNDLKTDFWINTDWKFSQKPNYQIERWTVVPKNDSTKLFYYDGYVPSESLHYVMPEYYPAATAIMVDALIDKFNLNNIDGHFSVSTFITIFNGLNIPEEIKREFNDNIKKANTGATGKRIMVNYQAPDSKEPSIQNLSSNDWADAFKSTEDSVQRKIIRGHGFPYLLIGDPVAGKLGGGNEKDIDILNFKNFYVRNRRNQLLSAFKQLFTGSSIQGELIFSDLTIFEEPSDDMKMKIMTLNEIRERSGFPAIEGGDVLASQYQATQATNQTVQPQSKFNAEGYNLSEEDFDKIKDFGVTADEFEFISEGEFVKSKQDFTKVQLAFEMMDEIAQYLLDNQIESTDLKTLKTEIRRELGINITSNELKSILSDITKSAITKIDVDSDGNIKVSKPTQPKRSIEVMYSYDVRPGYGKPIEDNTRPFCRKLVENNRFYTTEEIQTMTSIFGYDIFSYGGGWYRDPESGTLTSHCRHYFKAVTVSRKRR